MRIALLALLLAVPAVAQPAAPTLLPATHSIDGAFLARVKAHPSPAILAAVRAEADQALAAGPFSVIDKDQTPPSGDKHDYMSLAPYWWPDPAKPNGLPYIRHDGEINPERYKCTDDAEFNKLQAAVHALGLGYYFTGNEQYAAHAALLLRAWFLAPATRMNPNLNYAQAVLGVNTVRGTGLIDDRDLPRLLDGVALLSGSASLAAEDRRGLRNWFSAYLDWLLNSANGRDETAAKNNHGSWMDQQVAGIALYLGDSNLARKLAEPPGPAASRCRSNPTAASPSNWRAPILLLLRLQPRSYRAPCRTSPPRRRCKCRPVELSLAQRRIHPRRARLPAPLRAGRKEMDHEALNGVEGDILTEPLLLAAFNYRSPAYLQAAKKLEKNLNADTLLLQQQAEQALAAR